MKLNVDFIYPIGSIYMSVNSTNPSVLFGGTWEEWGSGRVPVGVDSEDADFNTAEKTGGEKEHILTIEEMPSHTHSQFARNWNVNTNNPNINVGANYNSQKVTSGSAGGNQPHNNLQPYITCYMWKRIA